MKMGGYDAFRNFKSTILNTFPYFGLPPFDAFPQFAQRGQPFKLSTAMLFCVVVAAPTTKAFLGLGAMTARMPAHAIFAAGNVMPDRFK